MEQTLLPFVANLTAQGVVTRAGSVLSKVLSIPATVEQTLLPLVANVTTVPHSTQGVVTRAASGSSEGQPTPATVEPPLPSGAANSTAIVTPVQDQVAASAVDPTILPASLSSQSVSVGKPSQQTTARRRESWRSMPGTQERPGQRIKPSSPRCPLSPSSNRKVRPSPTEVAEAATAASTASVPVDRGTALIAGVASGEETAETEEPVVSLPAGEGSGLLNALLPAFGNGTDEGWGVGGFPERQRPLPVGLRPAIDPARSGGG